MDTRFDYLHDKVDPEFGEVGTQFVSLDCAVPTQILCLGF